METPPLPRLLRGLRCKNSTLLLKHFYVAELVWWELPLDVWARPCVLQQEPLEVYRRGSA